MQGSSGMSCTYSDLVRSFICLKLKPDKFSMVNPISKLRVSLAIWDHTVLPATQHKRTHPVLTPAGEGRYSCCSKVTLYATRLLFYECVLGSDTVG